MTARGTVARMVRAICKTNKVTNRDKRPDPIRKPFDIELLVGIKCRNKPIKRPIV